MRLVNADEQSADEAGAGAGACDAAPGASARTATAAAASRHGMPRPRRAICVVGWGGERPREGMDRRLAVECGSGREELAPGGGGGARVLKVAESSARLPRGQRGRRRGIIGCSWRRA